jgi:predicted SnoaL-like aldol condensation-catalyzing enzyme
MKHMAAWILIAFCIPIRAQVPVTAATDQAALLQDRDPTRAANKQLVFDFWRTVLDAGHPEQSDRFLDENYIQHNPEIPTGRAAIIKLLSHATPKPVQPTIPGLVTIVADRDVVILAFVDEQKDPRKAGSTYTTTRFDMFRVHNGKIAEHWDNMRVGGLPPGGAPPPPPR